MNMTGIEKTGSPNHRFQFNQGTGDKTFQGAEGKSFKTERDKEFGLNWDMTRYRSYDSQVGRFWQVDPKADEGGQEVMTPYHYSLNNPVRYNDPMGDCPTCIVGGLIGGVTEILTQATVSVVTGQDVSIDWVDVVVATAAGAATGGLNAISSGAKLGKAAVTIVNALGSNKKVKAGLEVVKASADFKDGELDVVGFSDNKKPTDAIIDFAGGFGGGKVADAINGKLLNKADEAISTAQQAVTKAEGKGLNGVGRFKSGSANHSKAVANANQAKQNVSNAQANKEIIQAVGGRGVDTGSAIGGGTSAHHTKEELK